MLTMFDGIVTDFRDEYMKASSEIDTTVVGKIT
jgi:hypothetical protein